MPNSQRGISETDAERLFKNDLKAPVAAINKYVAAPLTQRQFDALVSFIFNVGVPRFKDSTLLKKLNQGDYDGAADEFKNWVIVHVTPDIKVRSKGLEDRREKERKIFVDGVYDKTR